MPPALGNDAISSGRVVHAPDFGQNDWHIVHKVACKHAFHPRRRVPKFLHPFAKICEPDGNARPVPPKSVNWRGE